MSIQSHQFAGLSGYTVLSHSGNIHSALVLLHGLGADGQDLISLAPILTKLLPNTIFLAPNAPQPCDMAPYGYQWFSLQDRQEAKIKAGIEVTSPILQAYLDAILQHYQLPDNKLALLGFSQGTMMSLYAAPRRKSAIAGVVGFSGALFGGEELTNPNISKPPILLIHGDDDMVVPVSAMPRALEQLETVGFPVKTLLRNGLGHGIDQEGLQAASQFLLEVL
ncbi:MAG: alpha/beta hydrolase [Alphaproteobacteria bacterium]